MSDNWNFYLLRVDHKIASIFVDLGIASDAPKAALPNMCYVRIFMRQPRLDGLSSPEEFDTLVAMEEALRPAAESNDNAVFVGRNTTNGFRDFVFYAKDIQAFVGDVEQVMKAFPLYTYEADGRPDADWGVYFDFLYPNPKQRQVMANRGVCEALRSRGDTLESVRRIDHWAYFREMAARNRFAMWVSAKGFTVTDSGESDADGEEAKRFRLVFRRDDKPCEIDDINIDLFETAAAMGGEYDGWECLVISS